MAGFQPAPVAAEAMAEASDRVPGRQPMQLQASATPTMPPVTSPATRRTATGRRPARIPVSKVTSRKAGAVKHIAHTIRGRRR